ncbi:DUF2283 domain-containing protein [Actinomadura chokoriensis]|uniref:DUF2283 domain-containing protein n=1 Tax=Actinomadura chokoriensis TaxID=454156 RepID=UPI0031F7966A
MDKSIERAAKVKISTEVDALYIQLADEIDPGESVRNESFRLKTRDSEMILDFSADKRLLGIEILGVEDLLKD